MKAAYHFILKTKILNASFFKSILGICMLTAVSDSLKLEGIEKNQLSYALLRFFQCTRLWFDLTKAKTTFERSSKVFLFCIERKNCFVYIENVIVFSNWIKIIFRVPKRIYENCRVDVCHYNCQTVSFLVLRWQTAAQSLSMDSSTRKILRGVSEKTFTTV